VCGKGEDLDRRSWPEIVTDILEASLTASSKTRIMYRSNLNFERFGRYFYGLVRKGFIEERNDSGVRVEYKTTARGRAFLKVLKQAGELFSSEEP